MYKLLAITLLFLPALTGKAQSPILNTAVTIECRQQPLSRVLDKIAATGKFYFSYAGNLFNKDSLVTLPRQTRSVGELLQLLFHGRLQPLEEGHYLILLPAPNKTAREMPSDTHYSISGTIFDERTGAALADVSVYDPATLSATMSKKDGSFTVRIKNKGAPIVLAISKESYIDTLIQLQTLSGRDLTIAISPDAFPPKAPLLLSQQSLPNDSIHIEWEGDSLDAAERNNLVPGVETTGFARLVLSYRLRMQTLNLKKLFVRRPVQMSLVPGLSTNGPLNSQVTNKFSINLVGGYSAGIKGIELGGVFDIERKSVKGIQAAGVLNMVGDSVKGVQLAGIANKDLGSVHGLQAAGIANTAGQVRGVQLAGILNRTHLLKGIQVGLINIADTSEGVSIGLINITHHGMHEFSVYADEWSPLNIAFRSGTPKFYSIYLAGMNPDPDRRSYYYGYGLGHQIGFTQRLSLRPELSILNLSPVDWHNFNHGAFLARLNIDLHWEPAKNIGLTAGPSFTFYAPQQDYYAAGRLYEPLPHGYSTFHFAKSSSAAWIGWRVAVNLF
ncbi:MAG TPA: hypothetical protein VGS79_09585 [Puia sp.]|nr:hypothetical protein [Puia sp.]